MCFSLVGGSLFADTSTTVDMTILQSIGYSDSTQLVAPMIASGTISFKSVDTSNAKGEVALRISSASIGQLTPDALIDQAWIRIRFPSVRLTVGKTRLSWGIGTVFNAGSVLGEDMESLAAELASVELKANSHWLAAVNIPTGPFSFAEVATIAATSMKLEEGIFGLRYYDSSHATGFEFGYATSLDSVTGIRQHRPYACLQGNLLVDWHLGLSASIIEDVSAFESLQESGILTAGISHIVPIGWDGSLSVRIEALARPAVLASGIDPLVDGKALLFYPELVWNMSESLTLMLRSIISPIDGSAIVVSGAMWRVMDGVTCLSYAGAKLGEDTDYLAPTGPGWTISAGVALTY